MFQSTRLLFQWSFWLFAYKKRSTVKAFLFLQRYNVTFSCSSLSPSVTFKRAVPTVCCERWLAFTWTQHKRNQSLIFFSRTALLHLQIEGFVFFTGMPHLKATPPTVSLKTCQRKENLILSFSSPSSPHKQPKYKTQQAIYQDPTFQYCCLNKI